MKVSYNWLNKYFDKKLPTPEKVAEALTFHAFEIEEIEEVDGDTVLDVKVLPDKAMWALSHRGIAKDLSTILDLEMNEDPLKKDINLEPKAEIEIKIATENCNYFSAASIKGVTVKESPKWLKEALEAIGQRSINNIVDASNYVMFDIGQPSHAFDAKNLPGGFLVRQANDGETLKALDEIEYTFSDKDTLISSLDGKALSIAGIKGGEDSGINEKTTDILVEVANWNPVTTRKTAARLKLRSDASSRYENGIVPEMVPHGLKAVTDLILEVAGGTLEGYSLSKNTNETDQRSVSVSLEKINKVLGLNLNSEEVDDILKRFGFSYTNENDIFTVISPFERTDLNIAEDLIEEIGRVYGLEHIKAVKPHVVPLKEINKRFYYSELVREKLTELGFSEIFTSSFRENDEVKMANAFAADKGCLRSSLLRNLQEALERNLPNADLLGLKQVRLYEIGTVWKDEEEKFMLALGACSPGGYKTKADDKTVVEALEALETVLNVDLNITVTDGMMELDFGSLGDKLKNPTAYNEATWPTTVTYKSFSIYPSMSRDIAMWVEKGTKEEEIKKMLKDKAGELCVRVTLFDKYEKDDRISYAYRLVFQSSQKTLESGEVDTVMEGVYEAVNASGFEVR